VHPTQVGSWRKQALAGLPEVFGNGQWVDPKHNLTIARQCELLGLARSTYYHEPQAESADNLRLMRRLDELYLKRPFFGSRKMAKVLGANRKRMQRLMRLMGIEAHYAKPNLSRPAPGHQVYPYRLRGVTIERANHVWCTDITYIPTHGGFLYLVAVMDWFSRLSQIAAASTPVTSACRRPAFAPPQS
jgi:putative transposase